MPAIKITDQIPPRSLQPGEVNTRRNDLYTLFGEQDLLVTGLNDGRGCYYAKVDERILDRFLSSENRQVFAGQQFLINDPPERNALRSVIIRNIDRHVDDYTREQIIENIHRDNSDNGIVVELMMIIPGTTGMMKLRFANQNMVYKVLAYGIKVLNQYIPPNSIEREVYIRLTPCYICYGYDHHTRDCRAGNITVCNKCSARNHKSDKCRSNYLKCLNCEGEHHTFANQCPVRKSKIKELSQAERKKRRDRSKSHMRSQSHQHPKPRSDANAPYHPNLLQDQTTAGAQQHADTINPTLGLDIASQPLMTTILSCILHASVQNALHPGCYQSTMDEVFDLNNIPRVKFPNSVSTTAILKGEQAEEI